MLHAQGLRQRREGAVSILSVCSPPFQNPPSLSFFLFLSHLSPRREGTNCREGQKDENEWEERMGLGRNTVEAAFRHLVAIATQLR
ncbi:hypothetical protein PUN28_004147 [Cardiocondyla obscurior]|uniref:Uncharacterized protein n=1 Tax=Cardiocondyla obscurior TaxID=286306 RepID=A0AAW2GPS2_9HYME